MRGRSLRRRAPLAASALLMRPARPSAGGRAVLPRGYPAQLAQHRRCFAGGAELEGLVRLMQQYCATTKRKINSIIFKRTVALQRWQVHPLLTSASKTCCLDVRLTAAEHLS